ncbi:NADH dehydrogenase (ubiquinone) B14.5 B subunit [Rhynchophorus ferrugineus]|uniref:NADH dehydrogenase [ubiquinone] 1 subunit C2 n=1 Tax=Rhynchophorus ferrugineus TaxID=354439 RepID=A0A834IP64_RHYFE|nr:hypothetical protein GWI33_005018 [Rhynchophorus ferrugineus]
MAGTGPQVARSPLELLNNQAAAEPPLLVKHAGPVIFSVVGFIAAAGANWATRRPLLSGVHRYVLIVGGSMAAGIYVEKKRAEHLATRDAMFRHYIELHPEDFPPYERKQFKDLFQEWIPIR